MNTPPSVRLVIAAFALLVVSVSSARAEEDKAAPNEPAKKPVHNPHGWPVLKKGMPAEELRRAIGDPDSVKPLETKEGAGEVWTYRRVARSSTKPISLGGGQDRLERTTIYQVSSLLIFDGKFVAATQKLEEDRRFD